MTWKVLHGDCAHWLAKLDETVDLTFLDPPFNQGKEYEDHDDNLPETAYWDWMGEICRQIYMKSSLGGSIYFMQREKNTEQVLTCLRKAGWKLQNLIIWKKLTSAVPGANRFGKHYQIIAFAVKGARACVQSFAYQSAVTASLQT